MKKPRKPTANEIQAFYSKLAEVQANSEALQAKFEEANAQFALMKQLYDFVDQLAKQGPNIRLEGPALVGVIPASQTLALFVEGYRHAMTDFVRALKNDFGGIEASLREEVLRWDIDPHDLETAWGETIPEC